jgi:hypothetical protein
MAAAVPTMPISPIPLAPIGPGQAEPLAEQVEQRHPRVDELCVADAVDDDGDLGQVGLAHGNDRPADVSPCLM